MDFDCLSINQRWSTDYFTNIELPETINESTSDNEEEGTEEMAQINHSENQEEFKMIQKA